jgi:hypothetical protein
MSGGTCNPGLTCSGGRCVSTGGGSSASSSSSTEDAQAGMGDDASTGSGDSSTSSGNDGSSSGQEASTSSDGTTGSGTNLITNGDFSQGTTLWGIVVGSAPIAVNGNELCINAPMGSGVTLGWPQNSTMPPLVLTASTSYTFSYKARAASAPVTVDAKVGNSQPPNYTADFETANDMVTTTLSPFTHTFTATTGDTSTGIAFAFTSSIAQNVCFQAVSLVQN